MGRSRFIGPLSLAVAAVAMTAQTARAQDIQYQKIVATPTATKAGDVAPGTEGNFFLGFERPTINASGQVAFYAVYGPAFNDPAGVGLWTGMAGELNLVARAGDAAPDATENFSGFGGTRVGLADTGEVIFLGTLAGAPSSTNNGIWIGTWDNIRLLAREGGNAPIGDHPNGEEDPPFYGATPTFNNNLGQAVIGRGGVGGFSSALQGDELDNALHEHSLFGGTADLLEPLALAGTQVFGESAGVLYAGAATTPRLNSLGQSAFAAGIKGNETGTAIFSGAPGDAAVVAAQGRAAPGMGTGITFEAIQFPDLNDAGEVAFVASLAGFGSDGNPFMGEAIYFGTVGNILPVAVIGQEAAGGPLIYDEFVTNFGPMLNDAGQIVFAAFVSDGVNGPRLAILAGDATDPETHIFVAQENGGLPSGATLQDAPLINNAGDIAFHIVDGGGDASLWLATVTGDLARIVGTGDQFLVDAGDPENEFDDDVREVLSLKMGSNTDGYQYLSDNGSVVFGLVFTDGSEGIFTSNIVIPEPGSLALLAGAGALLLARRRR